MKQLKKLLKKQGFTLVELIIVIAIIAVLAVAAFMMLTKWLGKSRDSRRLGDLGTISRGLQVGYSDVDDGINQYPNLDHQSATYVKLMSGTTVVGYQGVVDLEIAKGASMQKAPVDPANKEYYTYVVNASYQKFQVLAMLEDGSEASAFVNKVYARDYSDLIPASKGFKLGVVLRTSNNTPAQFIDGLTGVDLKASTDEGYKAIISDTEELVGTEMLAAPILIDDTTAEENGEGDGGGEPTVSLWPGWTSTDPSCDKPDVKIGDQIWAGCNSTLGDGREYNKDEGCHNYVGGDASGCNKLSNEKENAWNATYGIDNIWGKLYTWNEAMGNVGDGACQNGRSIPTDTEWEILETTLNGGVNCREGHNAGGCDGLGWKGYANKEVSNNIVKALEMPLSGYRDGTFSKFKDRGAYGYYRSSIDSGNYADLRYVMYNSNQIYKSQIKKTWEFSVRCIKN